MKIDRLVLGEFETNCYILRSSEQATDCLIIDTGLDVRPLMEFLENHKANPIAMVLTHGHIDHIAGVEELRAKYPAIKVYIHKADADLLANSVSNLSFMTGDSFSTDEADHLVNEPDIIEKAGIKLQVIHTAGHTPGGICLYAEQEGVVFVGDTLFADSVGRTDFPGGDMRRLIDNIKDKLLILPDATTVYPGHGPQTTIGREKTHNPFLH
ncbi:MAG: MBL fold metallo-hydrolase [Sedimentisphaerales bacterium]|nr:MBL fold metallo-hydrolase [Sedimentisphaerales bacterium]